MAWEGWFEYAGQEFLNVQRTEAYARKAGVGWLRCTSTTDLGPILGHDLYTNPIHDDAPWYDPDDMNTAGFWGVYPLGVSGIEDSTRSSVVVESVGDGGIPGRVRHSSKAVVFSVALVGEDDGAVDAGLRWLRQLLLGSACGNRATQTCNGDTMCYLSAQPQLNWDVEGDATECFPNYVRSLRKVVFNNGPTVTTKHQPSDGSAIWLAQFTAVAGSPFEYGPEVPIVESMFAPGVTNPYRIPLPDYLPLSAAIDTTGTLFDEVSCLPSAYKPVFDPNCAPLAPPPGPPSVPLGCFSPPQNWRRYQFAIPKDQIPLWGEVVPKIEVHATTVDLQNLRLRFYVDENGDGSIEDPCGFCGDLVLSYIPKGKSLVLDGSEQTVYVDEGGGVLQRADSLVYSTDGTPMDWPSLSCGTGYVVTIDTESGSTQLPTVDLSLYHKAS